MTTKQQHIVNGGFYLLLSHVVTIQIPSPHNVITVTELTFRYPILIIPRIGVSGIYCKVMHHNFGLLYIYIFCQGKEYFL